MKELHTGITEGIIAVTNHINRLDNYDKLKERLSEKWVTTKSIIERLQDIKDNTRLDILIEDIEEIIKELS